MRKPLYSLVAAFVALTLPTNLWASRISADELIKRHLEALGGAQAVARDQIRSPRPRRSRSWGPGSRAPWSPGACGRASRTARSRSVSSRSREGYDGERIWMIDPNGKLQIRRDRSSLEYQKTMCLLESQEYLFGGTGFALEAVGRDTVNGSPCEVLALTVDGGASARLFLNDSTFLLERMEIKAPEGNTVQTYGDYRRVGGVMFPFFVRTEMPALGQRIEMRYRSIAANESDRSRRYSCRRRPT